MAKPWVSGEQLAARLACAVDSIQREPILPGVPEHRRGRVSRFEVSEVDRRVRTGCVNRVGNKAAR